MPNIPVCVCVVVLDDEGNVATSARRHDHNAWGLPGGKLDPVDGDPTTDLQNTLLRAALRELREETGLQVEINDLVPLYTGVCKDESGGGHPDSVVFTFHAVRHTGSIETQEGEPPAAWNSWDVLIHRGSFADYNRRVLGKLRSFLVHTD